MNDNKKILFTGGGSAGHVTPNLALIEHARQQGYDVGYIGSYDGIERAIIERIDIPYYPIASGKLRRYFSLKNFIDPFKVLRGFFQACSIFQREKPGLLFSKGGFVSLPVVIAARFSGVPVVAHESDLSPGLTNRLSLPFVKTLCLTFPEALNHVKTKAKLVVTGTPVRKEFFSASAERGREFLGFNTNKKIVMIIGGGLGAASLNDVVWQSIEPLTKQFQVVHVCGKGKIKKINVRNYRSFEYLHDELFDIMAACDIVVSRSGANSLYELIALKKPHILIPLKQGSRGDQVLNARYFETLGLSTVLPQEGLTGGVLLTALQTLNGHFVETKRALQQYQLPDAVSAIWAVMMEACHAERSA